MPFGAYRALLLRYLGPHLPQVILLALLLLAGLGLQLAGPQIVRYFIDTAREGGAASALGGAAALYLGAAVVLQGVQVLETYVAEDLAWRATNALRTDLAGHVLDLDMAFHNARTPGELIERIDGDVSDLENFFSRFVLRLLSSSLLLAGVLVLIIHEEWRIGLCLCVLSAIALAVLDRVRAAGMRYFLAARQAAAELFGFLEEHLSGLPDIQASGAQSYVIHRLQQRLRALYGAARTSFLMGSILGSATRGVFAAGWVLVFVISAYRYREGAITLGTVYLMVQYTAMLALPLDQMIGEARDFQRAGAAIARVRELLELGSAATAQANQPGMRMLPSGPLSVEFAGVSFAYGLGRDVLHDISFHLPPGRVLGVAGRTGSGKTTLTRLILGLYTPQRGSIRLGGSDIASVAPDALYPRIGVVLQEVRLFSTSARDNVRLFDPSIPDARIQDVLEQLELGAWLRSLPAGLDTQLSPRDSGLSAGEAQLLAFARVFLREPDLVILDEASSRLDPATDRLIECAVDRLLAGRSAIVVAHRLSTLQRAHDILLLEDGEAVEYGPRERLARDSGSRFSALLQASSGLLAAGLVE